MRAPSRIDRNTVCSDLVNSNGTLTPAGDTALSCDNYGGQYIRFVLSMGVPVLHYRVPLGDVLFDLGLLAQLTGFADMVNMTTVESPNQVEFLTQDTTPALNYHSSITWFTK